jgi:hypothetical protein
MRRFLRSAVVVLVVPAACGGQTPAPTPSAPSAPSNLSSALAAARDVAPLVTGRQTIVVDDLTPGANNPIWCTYGTCPNCAFLIRRDGTIDTVQTWFDAGAMERAIRTLLGK